jgi:DNA-binding MarR family transcriptional regulator
VNSSVPGEHADDLAVGHALAQVLTWIRESRPGIGLSASSLSVLSHLDTVGPQRVTDLADREGITQPGVTTLVNRLAQAGLVTKSADPTDRRAVLVGITPLGTERITAHRAARAELVAARLLELDPDDQAALRAAVPALARLVTDRSSTTSPRKA